MNRIRRNTIVFTVACIPISHDRLMPWLLLRNTLANVKSVMDMSYVGGVAEGFFRIAKSYLTPFPREDLQHPAKVRHPVAPRPLHAGDGHADLRMNPWLTPQCTEASTKCRYRAKFKSAPSLMVVNHVIFLATKLRRSRMIYPKDTWSFSRN